MTADDVAATVFERGTEYHWHLALLIEQFNKANVEAEREACAAVADDMANDWAAGLVELDAIADVAREIRARGGDG